MILKIGEFCSLFPEKNGELAGLEGREKRDEKREKRKERREKREKKSERGKEREEKREEKRERGKERRKREEGQFSAVWAATIFSKAATCREFKTEKLSPKSKKKLPLKFLSTRCTPLIAFDFARFVLSARARARARAPGPQKLGPPALVHKRNGRVSRARARHIFCYP